MCSNERIELYQYVLRTEPCVYSSRKPSVLLDGWSEDDERHALGTEGFPGCGANRRVGYQALVIVGSSFHPHERACARKEALLNTAPDA